MDSNRTILWDWPTRLFHWSLLPLIFLQWLLAENSEAVQDYLAGKDITFDAMLWHARFGFILLFLLLFRIVWGFVGSSSSRFSHFVKKPRDVIAYAKTLSLRNSSRYAGHNPLGAWMVLGLLFLIGVQIFSGLFLTDDIAMEGPFYATISETIAEAFETVHAINFNILLLAITLHISAVFYYLIYKQQNLISPMMHGKTDLPYQNQHSISAFKVLLVAAVAAIPVWWLSARYW